MGELDWADFDGLDVQRIDEPDPVPDPDPEPDPDPLPIPEGFAAVVDGVRPRGVQCDAYELTPASTGREWFVATGGDDAAAGTENAPLGTIARAAELATAGDVVTIGAGEYRDAVWVQNGGTAEAPIVFQAAECGTVVLAGGGDRTFRAASFDSNWRNCHQEHVTLKGLVFRDFADLRGDPDQCHGTTIAVGACTGWRVEDCSFERAADRAVAAYGSEIVVTRSTIAESGGYSIIGAGEGDAHIQDLEFTDLLLERNNDQGLLGPGCGASVKILFSDGVLVDNVESHDNVGPGWWFDWDNYDWTIRNSYFHDARGRDAGWEGPGVWIEGPGGGGLFENNVLFANAGAGLGLFETQGHVIRGNLFVEDHVEIRGIVNGARAVPSDITITDNDFRRTGTYTSIGDWGDTTPEGQGFVVDRNTYDVGDAALFRWNGREARSLAEMQSLFGFEAEGLEAPVPWPPQP